MKKLGPSHPKLNFGKVLRKMLWDFFGENRKYFTGTKNSGKRKSGGDELLFGRIPESCETLQSHALRGNERNKNQSSWLRSQFFALLETFATFCDKNRGKASSSISDFIFHLL